MKNKLLLFDNARSHIAKSVLESIKNSGNDYVLNIPYNPQTNPIESYFSELKHYIKLDSKIEYIDLLKSIKNSIKKIKKSHYKNHFVNSLCTKNSIEKKLSINQKRYIKNRISFSFIFMRIFNIIIFIERFIYEIINFFFFI